MLWEETQTKRRAVGSDGGLASRRWLGFPPHCARLAPPTQVLAAALLPLAAAGPWVRPAGAPEAAVRCQSLLGHPRVRDLWQSLGNP